ncbi:MAG: orotate phosphoribosyltransferase [Candidatus Kapaibacteriales bacterium]
MTDLNRKNLAKQIFEVAHLRGNFTLRSGQTSNEYFDKYQFESQPNLLSDIALMMLKTLPKEYDLYAALEMGGIPIATAIALKTGKPMVFVRKQAKEYGTAKLAEGGPIKGKRLLIVEDVVTSGGQIIKSVEELRERGAQIFHAVCVIDREQGGREALAKEGIQLLPLFTATDLKNTQIQGEYEEDQVETD